jgi:uncharacterized membrane protein
MAVRESHGAAVSIELDRIMFFSDAVFAIAITLLVLEIKVPEREAIDSARALGAALAGLLPRFFAFFLSFVVVGYYWFMHHTIFRYIRRWDDAFILINLLLLLCVAFLPFPVAVFGSFRHYPSALVLYASSLAAAGIVQGVLWTHATRRRRLVDPQLDRHTVALIYLRALALPAVFAISIPLSFISPTWAMLSWFLVAPALRIIRMRLQKKSARKSPSK